jgi:hypothetical protein
MKYPGITIGLRRASAPAAAPPPGGGKFATPPGKRLQGLGLGAMLGGVIISAGLWISRRRARS